MNITVTLLFQVIAFLLMIWLVRRYMWGPLNDVLTERQKSIEEGLEAAEQGKAEFQKAEERAQEVISNAKAEAQEILNSANKRSGEIREEAMLEAREAKDKEVQKAKMEIEQEVNNARELLRKEVGSIIMLGVKKVVEKEADEKNHKALIDDLIKQI